MNFLSLNNLPPVKVFSPVLISLILFIFFFFEMLFNIVSLYPRAKKNYRNHIFCKYELYAQL